MDTASVSSVASIHGDVAVSSAGRFPRCSARSSRRRANARPKQPHPDAVICIDDDDEDDTRVHQKQNPAAVICIDDDDERKPATASAKTTSTLKNSSFGKVPPVAAAAAPAPIPIVDNSMVNEVLSIVPHADRMEVASLLLENDVQTVVMTLLGPGLTGKRSLPTAFGNGEEDSKMPARPSPESKGDSFECYCCFVEYPFGKMCVCVGGQISHLICSECLKSYTESQIFGSGKLGIKTKDSDKPAMHLQCFKDDCNMGFSRDILEKALPPKTLARYDELLAQISLDAAGLDNLVKCPKCDFQAELDPGTNVFSCPIETCRFKSCRKCGLEAAGADHSCEEAKQKQHAASGTHKIEEAMTLAKMRSCPQCKRNFLKESGCNKMTCPNCGCLSCYVCRQSISDIGYKHFCQTPHCTHKTCGKCQLHSSDESLDKKDEAEMRKAGLEAAGEVNSPSKTGVVDQLLNDPAKKASPAKKRRRR